MQHLSQILALIAAGFILGFATSDRRHRLAHALQIVRDLLLRDLAQTVAFVPGLRTVCAPHTGHHTRRYVRRYVADHPAKTQKAGA